MIRVFKKQKQYVYRKLCTAQVRSSAKMLDQYMYILFKYIQMYKTVFYIFKHSLMKRSIQFQHNKFNV